MDYLVHHMLRTSAQRLAEKEAVIHGAERLAYRDLADRVEALAAALQDAGIQRGDRVGIYLEASVPQVIAIFAASRAGGVFVSINSERFPGQVSHILKDCGMKALITSGSRIADLETAIASISTLEFVVAVGSALPAGLQKPVYSYEELLKAEPDPARPD